MHFPQEAIGDALPKQGGKTLSRHWTENLESQHKREQGGEKGKQILQ